jgi:peptide/nickel transport system ATP-binding protein
MRDFDFKTAAPSAAGAATTVLAVNNLTISLPLGADRPHAIRHVSLDVRQGEIVCLLGESGSGKSVIAQAVMGLLPAALKAVEGSIELLGEDVLTASAVRIR